MQRPPESMVGATIRLDRTRRAHGAGLAAAVARSLPELVLFMDWAADSPTEAEDYAGFLDRSEVGWSDDTEYNFVIVDPTIGEVIGACGLMRRVGPGAIELGYWVRSDCTGRGVATEAAGVLTEAAADLAGIERIEIRHDEANAASGRVAEKLGYTVLELRQVEIDLPGESGVEVIWSQPTRPAQRS